jgi:asparagine synthase (glutamine-hydrolysing)
MIADVPLGAFLSGGIDSSTVVALMQQESRERVRTFTIGFPERSHDEAAHAKAVAAHLGTEHTELYVAPSDMLSVIPRLPALYDEPFGDSSQVPTFLVSQLTRRSVTVSLSGDGGDELFGGYDRYRRWRGVWGAVRWLPYRLRRGCAFGLEAAAAVPCLEARGQKLAAVLRAETPEVVYRELLSHGEDPTQLVVGATEPGTVFTSDDDWPGGDDFVGRMMHVDLVSYLPDDILVKVDRASMGVGLESRAPFLDHRVIDLAWHLPSWTKLRNGKGKWLLRQVLHRYVPPELVERPKHGFGVPLGRWLAGPLREWAEDLLAPSRLERDGFFQPSAIREKWTRQLGGAPRWQDFLWTVLMFQSWRDCQ